MSWFDDLLNFLIPIVLYVILGFWLWRMFSPMFKDIGGGEGGWWDKLWNKNIVNNKEVNVTYE